MSEKYFSKNFFQFLWRVIATHTITYFIAGIIFSRLFNYTTLFSSEILSEYMKPTSSPWVAAGPGLNILRGALFALVLWPFKSVFINTKKGWLKLWLLIVGLAILGTAAAAQGSLEGIIYSRLPLALHFIGMSEILAQTFFFSLFLYGWYKKPMRFLNVISVIFVVLIALMSIAGFLVAVEH